MKNAFFISVLCLVSSMAFANDNFEKDKKDIEKTIKDFSKAGDDRNLETIENLLDDNYRIVMNQLFGSKEVALMDKSTYLSMIKSEKFGGDDRKVEIMEIIINGNSAIAHVNLWGKAMNVASIFSLVKNEKGNWKLISDTPTILE